MSLSTRLRHCEIPSRPWLCSLLLVWPLIASAVTVSETPLLVSNSAPPNVMLLVDTSGSMNNIIWASGYNDKTDYPDWSNGGDNWNPDYGNNFYSSLVRDTCVSGWKKGVNSSGTTKCLRLPDPVGGGNTRYSGNYLNYLFNTYATNTDLTTGTIPTDYRMNVARDVATTLVTTTPGMRFGTSSFYGGSGHNSGYGATIDAGCGSSSTTLSTAISGYTSSYNTPLSEALYEVTRYFRGLSSYYHSGTTYTSPIEYRCQKNFAIVITDGMPTYDMDFPLDDPDDAGGKLPNWDETTGTPATTKAMYPNFPQYSDGYQHQPAGAQNEEGYSLYLDDIAKFAYDTDMKKTGTDLKGGSYQDSQFPIQNLATYTVGFSTSNQMLIDAAAYGHGISFTSSDKASLAASLQLTIGDINGKTSSSSAVATNSTRLNTGTEVYQASFDSADWSGHLRAIPVNGNGTLGSAKWDAATGLPAPASRTIFTYNSSATPKGVAFLWANLNAQQQTNLNTNISGVNDGLGSDRLTYLRGDDSKEQSKVNGVFRNRSYKLGDIVNSDPVFVGTPDFRFDLLPNAEGTDYTAFRSSSSYQARTPMIYVGANDGMLHGFDAATGVEKFAYIPADVYPKLSHLTAPAYTHRFYVDAAPTVVDAYLDSVWKTVLIGSTGAGGKSVFALDVTSPNSFSTGSVLWEYTNSELGVAIGQPTIARMADGSWAAIFGNGYNSTGLSARLFIVNLATGVLIKAIDTGNGNASNPNGMSTPIPVDMDGDRITDVIYAGDLRGNLWKFDVSSTNSGTWDNASKRLLLFTAQDASANRQPITVRPEVGTDSSGNPMVYFGTGKYFEVGDNQVSASPLTQTFYGIRDTGTAVNGRTDLQVQTILAETNSQGFDLRVVSANTVAATKKGWYLDLVSPVSGSQGERVVSGAVLRSDRIIFSTLIPDADPCSFGGTSWLMEMDALTGARLTYSAFDLNNDNLFTSSDFVTVMVNGVELTAPVSGKKSKEGVIKTPTIVSAGDVEFKFASGSTGNIEVTKEKGAAKSGRQSWRQLQ